MKISILGSGYVGLCTGVGFALKNNDVICVDIDRKKVDAINSGVTIIEEAGLQEAMKSIGKKLTATTDIATAVRDSSITFVCVGTPSMEDGSIDTKYLENASREIGTSIKEKNDFHIVVIKSTVAPGVIEEKLIPLIEKSSGKKSGDGFGVCVNPEFLSEGTALTDFINPDRIVIGENDKKSGDILESLYKDFSAPIVRTDMKTAEMIKYASNTFLAAKVTMINEIGNICKKLGIDVYDVAKGIGYDKRIGNRFLNAGIGFGGSCFSKDVQALCRSAKQMGYDARILDCILDLNKNQRMRIIELLKLKLPGLHGKHVAVLGLAFKANTDDIRDSPAIDIVSELIKEGCKVSAYDPKAAKNFEKLFPGIKYAKNMKEAVENADACLILTDWSEFMSITDEDFSAMNNKIIIEGRRVLDKSRVKNFEGVCW
ncbi:UDP-glucose/GDP-mannose dehydrogenase family protein [archaeon]|nr:UDP-glucose/GDP-mannose dehydrogenase family protein [archaeon]